MSGKASGKKKKYRMINGVTVEKENGRLVKFKGYLFERKKKNYLSKKLGIQFDIYYCLTEGCNVCIRKEIRTGSYFHSNLKDSSDLKPHKHNKPRIRNANREPNHIALNELQQLPVFSPQIQRQDNHDLKFGNNHHFEQLYNFISSGDNGDVPVSSRNQNIPIYLNPPPTQLLQQLPSNDRTPQRKSQRQHTKDNPRNYNKERRISKKQKTSESDLLGKRSWVDMNPVDESVILGILADKGPLGGLNHVGIYFSISVEDGMDRFLDPMNNWVSFIRFGTNNAPRFEKPSRVADKIRLEKDKFKNHPLLSTCSSAQFVVKVVVPPGDIPGYVNVALSFIRKLIIKERAYKYVNIEKKSEEAREDNSNFADNVGLFFDRNDEQNFESYENGSGLVGINMMEEEDFGNMIFNSPFYFNLIAQNKIEEVKKLLKKKIIDLDRRDLMGFTALDVAKHFKRTEIIEQLLKNAKKPYILFFEKIKIMSCKSCDNEVKRDGNKINHICKGLSSKAIHENTTLGSLKIFHLRGSKRHSVVSNASNNNNTHVDDTYWANIKSFLKNGVCGGCKMNFTGNELYQVGKRSLVIIAK